MTHYEMAFPALKSPGLSWVDYPNAEAPEPQPKIEKVWYSHFKYDDNFAFWSSRLTVFDKADFADFVFNSLSAEFAKMERV